MIELAHRLAEPAELRQHRTANPGGTWNDAEFGAVKPIVRHQLNREQEGLCVYCETELGEDEGHVEHIKSKGLNPPLTFVYDNLAHSCNGPTIGPGHCGHRKKRQVLTIEPRPGCNRFFSVMILDGRVVAASGLTPGEAQQATGTVNILGLNAASLSWQRKGYANAIIHLSTADKADFLATIPFRWALRSL